MKTVKALGDAPISLPLAADEIIELHAARLLLLLHHCGSGGQIAGLTKLAKIDFFVRYPSFFKQVAKHLDKPISIESDETESAMLRYHYGPWDKRYYQVLPFLEARRLINVEKHGNAYNFMLTELGQRKAESLTKSEPFVPLVRQIKEVKKILGRKTGNQLKNLVYELFDAEVKQRQIGEVIK